MLKSRKRILSILAIIALAFFSILLLHGSSDKLLADADDYCAGYCYWNDSYVNPDKTVGAYTRVVDVYDGCNDFGSYCTQNYDYQTITCNSSCSYNFSNNNKCENCTLVLGTHAGSCCVNGSPPPSPCTPSCTASCPSGTTTTNTNDYHSQVGGGSDGCSGTCSTINCYCPTCSFSNTCADFGYSGNSALEAEYGKVPNTLTPSCRNGDSDTPDRTTKCNMRYRDCYCDEHCIPSACPANTTEDNTDPNTIYGSIYGTTGTEVYPECYNDCNKYQSRDCYYICDRATCADLPSKADNPWQDDCTPTATQRCVEVPDISVPIPRVFPGCITEETLTCYYLSALPEVDTLIAIDGDYTSYMSMNENDTPPLLSKLIRGVSAQTEDSVLSFTSSTHTGKTLNNPVKVEGVYSDSDGSDDIMALYVWWSPETSKVFTTPTNLDNALSGKTANQENFGILISRDYNTEAWSNVYIPDISGSSGSWTRAGTVNDVITVRSSNGESLTKIHSIDVTDNSDGTGYDSNRVFLEMYMYYSPEDTSSEDIPDTERYNLWGSVNDQAGYLPFDASDYPAISNEIIDSEDKFWKDKGNDWNLDMINPDGSIVSVSDSYYKEVKINVTANDTVSDPTSNNGRLSYIRLDACKSGDDALTDLYYYDTNGTLKKYNHLGRCDDGSVVDTDGFIITDMTNGDSLLGRAGGYTGNPLNLATEDLIAEINLGDNKDGSLTFYLTVMDMAGNNNYSEQKTDIYKLEQWAAVEDGLVYGGEGVNSSTRTVEFAPHTVLDRLTEPYPDLTNQVLLGGYGVGLEFGLGDLVRTLSNKAYKATNFPGILMSSVYTELTEAYERKSNNSDFDEKVIPTGTSSISGTLTDPGVGEVCLKEYCIWTWSPPESDPLQPLTISSGFECNKKGLIIANGNVVINPGFTNSTSSDACIILTNGNITINDGAPGVGTPSYDIVEAFLISAGYIEIPGGGGAVPDDEGLFVEGGLVGFADNASHSTVYSTRELIYSSMGNFPVLVVKGNSKYGLLSRTLFGSQIDIFKSEVGFKPY